MRKRYISLLLALTATIFAITGCSSNAESTSSEKTTKPSSEISETESNTEEATTEEVTTEETTTEEATTEEVTTEESTTQEPTTPEPTTPAVIVDKNKDKYIAAAKKVVEQYGGQAAAFDDADGDGIPELIYAEYMAERAFSAYLFVYENGEYRDSQVYIDMYEGMRLYKDKEGGKYFGLEISDHFSGVTYYLHDFENLKRQEIRYVERVDGKYVYKNETLFDVEQVNEKIFAEMEETYTYIRDMSKVVVWEDYNTDKMIEKAYDNYSKSK